MVDGKGWIIEDMNKYIAFAIRFPKNKLALLYCIGESQRIGVGTKLLKRIEEDAQAEGISTLITEASLISYKLLLMHNWKIIRKEKINIKESIFERYKMIKNIG